MRCKLKSSWIVLNLEAINILWQILWLRNTHIIAGGEGFTGLLIMTKLLNILKQELDPLKTTTPPSPLPHLRFLQGKSVTTGKYMMPSSKQIQPREWQVS